MSFRVFIEFFGVKIAVGLSKADFLPIFPAVEFSKCFSFRGPPKNDFSAIFRPIFPIFLSLVARHVSSR